MLRLSLFLALCASVSAIGLMQSAGVYGVLMCDDKPAHNVKVKLYEEDTTNFDDLMAEGKTDSSGRFELVGHDDEFSTIDPKLNIYHDCNDGIKPCQRKITVYIPDSYISSGEKPKKLYNLGTLNLAGKFAGETRDCLNRV